MENLTDRFEGMTKKEILELCAIMLEKSLKHKSTTKEKVKSYSNGVIQGVAAAGLFELIPKIWEMFSVNNKEVIVPEDLFSLEVEYFHQAKQVISQCENIDSSQIEGLDYFMDTDIDDLDSDIDFDFNC